MKLSVRSHNTPILALALCLACVCVCTRTRRTRAQESVALPPVRLVAELKGYEGPSGFNGRPAVALFSPDGRLLLTTSEKGVRLWDASNGALITTLQRSRFPAHFSPDGRRLVTGGTDKTAYLYELRAD